MTKQELIKIVMKIETQQEKILSFGLINMSKSSCEDANKFIETHALVRIENDILTEYRKDYHKAFNEWYKAGMPE